MTQSINVPSQYSDSGGTYLILLVTHLVIVTRHVPPVRRLILQHFDLGCYSRPIARLGRDSLTVNGNFGERS